MVKFIELTENVGDVTSLSTVVGALTGSITINSTDATNQAATDTAFTATGNGTGAEFDVTIAGNAVTVVTATSAGTGYAIGDVITFPTSAIGGTTDVTVTLVADDFVNNNIAVGSYLLPVNKLQSIVQSTSTLTTVTSVDGSYAITHAASSPATTPTMKNAIVEAITANPGSPFIAKVAGPAISDITVS